MGPYLSSMYLSVSPNGFIHRQLVGESSCFRIQLMVYIRDGTRVHLKEKRWNEEQWGIKKKYCILRNNCNVPSVTFKSILKQYLLSERSLIFYTFYFLVKVYLHGWPHYLLETPLRMSVLDDSATPPTSSFLCQHFEVMVCLQRRCFSHAFSISPWAHVRGSLKFTLTHTVYVVKHNPTHIVILQMYSFFPFYRCTYSDA